MGLFDTTKTGGIGFAKVVNKQDFTNYDLLDKLSGVKVSFGVPTMGDIRGVESVMYKNVTATHDVFARVDGKNVIMGKIATDGVGTVVGKTSITSDMEMISPLWQKVKN